MRFTYIGPGETEVFGIKFRAGEAVEVADEHAIRKLTHNHLFSSSGNVETEAPKRRGRTPKVRADGEDQG